MQISGRLPGGNGMGELELIFLARHNEFLFSMWHARAIFFLKKIWCNKFRVFSLVHKYRCIDLCFVHFSGKTAGHLWKQEYCLGLGDTFPACIMTREGTFYLERKSQEGPLSPKCTVQFFWYSRIFFFVIPSARHSACTIPTWPLLGRGPLKHLCNLEVGYWGVWAPNFSGAAPGFEPRISCLRVRSVTITPERREEWEVAFILLTFPFRNAVASAICSFLHILFTDGYRIRSKKIKISQK